MKYSIAFLGVGGQGIVFVAEVLSEALFRQGKYVAQLQSYGAEVRGGTVLAYVVVDDEPIDNPFIEGFTIALILHKSVLSRWQSHIRNSQYVFADRDLVGDVTESIGKPVVLVPIYRVSMENSVSGSENIVALGFTYGTKLVSELDPAIVYEVLNRKAGAEKNIKAFRVGLELGERYRAQLT